MVIAFALMAGGFSLQATQPTKRSPSGEAGSCSLDTAGGGSGAGRTAQRCGASAAHRSRDPSIGARVPRTGAAAVAHEAAGRRPRHAREGPRAGPELRGCAQRLRAAVARLQAADAGGPDAAGIDAAVSFRCAISLSAWRRPHGDRRHARVPSRRSARPTGWNRNAPSRCWLSVWL